MSKRTDKALLRAIRRAWDKPALLPNTTVINIHEEMARYVRREKAKAWDACYVRICESDLCIAADLKVPRDSNPYRGRAKR